MQAFFETYMNDGTNRKQKNGSLKLTIAIITVNRLSILLKGKDCQNT